MADTKTQAGFDFLLDALKANRGASYGDLRVKAEAKGFKVYPIMYGRAKAVLGLAKAKPKGAPKAASKGTKAVKRGRPAGGGESKSERIRGMLRSGMAVAEIVKKVGCTPGLVYNVKSTMGKTAGGVAKRGPGRPPKAASTAAGLEGVIAALKDGERERAQLMRALEQIRSVLASVG